MPTRETKRGYEPLAQEDEKTTVRAETPAAKPERKPPLEVNITRVRAVAGRAMLAQLDGQAPVLEVWTRNTIYFCDAGFVCVEIRDRATNLPETKHVALGAKLLGGHKRYAKTLHLVRPLPMPGTQAVFLRPNARRDAQAYTSAVERVVFNYQVTALELSTDTQEAWADVTNYHLR
jgi:hypothetical protein